MPSLCHLAVCLLLVGLPSACPGTLAAALSGPQALCAPSLDLHPGGPCLGPSAPRQVQALNHSSFFGLQAHSKFLAFPLRPWGLASHT